MKIKDLPWYDKPNQRLKRYGAGSLTDAELLMVILGKVKGEGVLELSNRLLKKYNLHKLYDLGFESLKKECNDDEYATLRILSLIQLCKRYNQLVKGGYSKKPITCAKDIFDMFLDRVGDYKEEHLYCVLLDTKNFVIGVKRIGIGTLNASLIHPREVFKAAIKERSNSIILVHNHPSGDCNPSEEDLEVTKVLMKAGETLNIPVLDHVVIGKEKYWSWREEN